MRRIISLIAGIGGWLVSLSDRARLQLIIGFLLLLGGSGIYKLVVSIRKLSEPLPAASPAQFIEPMEDLFRQTKNNVGQYQQARQQEVSHLDSLAKTFNPKNKLRP